MIVVDRLLVGGIKFVLGKVAAAVDAELNDEGRLKDSLLAAQMRLELGEIDEDEFRTIERDVLARMREIRERQRGEADSLPARSKVSEVEATVELGHHRR